MDLADPRAHVVGQPEGGATGGVVHVHQLAFKHKTMTYELFIPLIYHFSSIYELFLQLKER